jgi:hypothetical protein
VKTPVFRCADSTYEIRETGSSLLPPLRCGSPTRRTNRVSMASRDVRHSEGGVRPRNLLFPDGSPRLQVGGAALSSAAINVTHAKGFSHGLFRRWELQLPRKRPSPLGLQPLKKAVIPFTLIVILPTNKRLLDPSLHKKLRISRCRRFSLTRNSLTCGCHRVRKDCAARPPSNTIQSGGGVAYPSLRLRVYPLVPVRV